MAGADPDLPATHASRWSTPEAVTAARDCFLAKRSYARATNRTSSVAGTIVSFGCLAMSKAVVSDGIGAVPA